LPRRRRRACSHKAWRGLLINLMYKTPAARRPLCAPRSGRMRTGSALLSFLGRCGFFPCALSLPVHPCISCFVALFFICRSLCVFRCFTWFVHCTVVDRSSVYNLARGASLSCSYSTLSSLQVSAWHTITRTAGSALSLRSECPMTDACVRRHVRHNRLMIGRCECAPPVSPRAPTDVHSQIGAEGNQLRPWCTVTVIKRSTSGAPREEPHRAGTTRRLSRTPRAAAGDSDTASAPRPSTAMAREFPL
jgi:hypothetical protein